MKEYFWSNNDFNFKIEMDADEKPRWDGYGIYQVIKLYVNNFNIYYTEWGVDQVFDTIRTCKNEVEDPHDENTELHDIYFRTDKIFFRSDLFDLDFKKLEGDSCTEFYNWFISSISVTEGRKMKISKLKENIKNG